MLENNMFKLIPEVCSHWHKWFVREKKSWRINHYGNNYVKNSFKIRLEHADMSAPTGKRLLASWLYKYQST